MTIEEKAKAYDERLTKARKEYSIHEANNAIGIMDALERVLPELKESEDEKIRKALIEMVHDTTGDSLWVDYNVHKEDALAWLEKQGKNNMGISETTKQKLEDNLNKALEKETPESFNEFLDEQKHTPKHKVGDTIYYNSFGELKSMVVANVVTDSTDNPMYEDKEGNAVFEKVLVEQNPAWSEEDEDILNTIINHFKVDIECTDEDDVIRWLKSLKGRYTWKPSKEQMEALEHFVRSIGESDYASPYDNNTKLLYSLLSDLKKLKE